MAVDWLADVRIYAANADDKVVDAIIRYCGIALQSRDGQLVAMADKKERELVRENFLKKKLAITDPDSVLDDAISSVAERMKADRTKNRVTVYYLLAEQFGLLNVFGGVSGAAGGAGAAVAGLAAAGLGAVSGTASAVGDAVSGVAGAATGAAAAVGGAVVGAAGAASDAVGGAVSGAANLASDAASGVAGVATGAAAAVGGAVAGAAGLASGAAGKLGDMASAPLSAVTSGYDDDDGEGKGIWGWLKWLLLAALIAALLFWLLRSCSHQEATPVAGDATTEATETVATPATETTAPAIPTGSGVVGAERDGKPMLTVYFDTGKSDVSNDLTAAAAKVKDYVASNAGSKLAVSGFNDPTGNAAINAELSKKRAQGVAKALEAVGIPAASIEMVKPADSTDTSGDNSAARRVEVTVQ